MRSCKHRSSPRARDRSTDHCPEGTATAPSRGRDLLPSLRGLKLLGVERDEQQVTITVGSSLICGRCPTCGSYSKRVHSRYWRTLRDLPLLGASVIVRWQTRRFFSGRQSCSQRIFAERLPEMAASHARRTARLAEVVRSIGFVCGGEPGARLAKRLGITLSPDTMLREIRRTAIPQPPQPRVLGVDDWAFQKGQEGRPNPAMCSSVGAVSSAEGVRGMADEGARIRRVRVRRRGLSTPRGRRGKA